MKTVRQKYFVSRQLRFSVAIMVLWSFLTIGILDFLTIEFSKKINTSFMTVESKLLIISLIFLAYISVFYLFIMSFSNKFIGPFERLKKEISIFLDGNFQQRLKVREQDDVYISSFLEAVNKILNRYETTCRQREKLLKTADEEIIQILSAVEQEGLSKDYYRKALLTFRQTLQNSAE